MEPDFTPAAEPVARLIGEFNKLPGVGPKTAQRFTYFLLKQPEEEVRALAEALLAIKDSIITCSSCQNLVETDPCPFCSSSERDSSRICVVEEPMDILALERSRGYKGLYHVLHGAISPMDGIGPEELKIKELIQRLQKGEVEEVILATNPNLEGEATAMYLYRLMTPFGVRVTRLARGLPMGGDLEYADEVTLMQALEGRRQFQP
ncbi:MAG: recombination mediator RecR [Dehalococcoidia bacterium]|nr:recombination mediator RecR [Dehalococcoidia bacterium]MDZ4247613.1 recombination mediator RecR [Dehalococcoidia bacterium]